MPNKLTGQGNILKDSFYKQRLLNSHMNTLYGTKPRSQQQIDAGQPTPQQQSLNFRQLLTNFGMTTCGTTYGFLQFTCTHKKLRALRQIRQYKYLQKVDLSYNCLPTLHDLSGLKHLTEIRAVNNQLTNILDMKQIPLHLDYVDLSSNNIVIMPSLERHKHLRVLKLRGNKIVNIFGISQNAKLEILDLSENQLQQIKCLDGLNLKQLYLRNNKIEAVKGLTKLSQLRVLDLSINLIHNLAGLTNLIALRSLNLAKNRIAKVKQLDNLQNLAYIHEVDLCYNPIQQRKYYRLQVLYKLPMLETLDGTKLTSEQVVAAEAMYGLDVEEKYNIFKQHIPEEEFVDRRIHRCELVDKQTESDGVNNQFIDQYDQQGRKTNSNSRNSKGFYASRRSGISKQSKQSRQSKESKRSALSK